MEINRKIVALNFVLFLFLAVSVWAMPSGHFVLVVTDPQAGPDASFSVIDHAGGSFVSAGRYPWMTIAYSDADDFAARLMRAGAIFVLNHKLAAGCQREE
ncbi:MAG: hypothetical protein ACOH2J_19395 [Allorhizobium sp.]